MWERGLIAFRPVKGSHEFRLSSWLVNLPLRATKIEFLIAGLIKGNQWVFISPYLIRPAIFFWGVHKPMGFHKPFIRPYVNSATAALLQLFSDALRKYREMDSSDAGCLISVGEG